MTSITFAAEAGHFLTRRFRGAAFDDRDEFAKFSAYSGGIDGFSVKHPPRPAFYDKSRDSSPTPTQAIFMTIYGRTKMTRITTAVLAAFVIFAGFPGLAPGQGDLPWETDVEAALKKAKEAGRPVLILLHDRREIACKRMVSRVYADAEVRAAMRNFVLVPTCPDREGRPLPFGGISEEQLADNESFVRRDVLEAVTVTVPQHLFLAPDGKVLLRKLYELKKSAFLDLMAEAQSAFSGVAIKGLAARQKKLFETVRNGSQKDKSKAVQTIAENDDPKTLELLYLTVQGLPEAERAVCIRALGYDRFSHAGPILLRWLADRSKLVRHCAVVTLEETAGMGAMTPILDLHEKTKDSEVKKDCLRALGPCASGDEKVRDLLLSKVKDRKEPIRVASYLSLGHFLHDDAVRDVLKKRYKKEGRAAAAKAAILWAYHLSGESDQVDVVKSLMKSERSGQLSALGAYVIKSLESETGKLNKTLKSALRPIYARDRIQRNAVKDWGSGRGKRKR